jgi:hypothetical protein
MDFKQLRDLMAAYQQVHSQDIEERYKGKHGQSSAEYRDDRSQGGKMVSGDSKMSGAEYTHGRRVKAANPGSQPDEGGKTKPKSQGKMDRGTRADLEYRKANLKKEETSVDEAVYGGTPKKAEDKRMTVTAADKKGNTPAYQRYKAGDKRYKAADHMKEGVRDVDPEKGTAERKARLEKKRGMKLDDHPQYKKEEVEVDEAMSSYDRNRKRAAQRAADRNAARAAGKTGVVPGVGYVSPRKERETYVDSAGTTRHKSGAKMEELKATGLFTVEEIERIIEIMGE